MPAGVGLRPVWYETPAPLAERDYNTLHSRFGAAAAQRIDRHAVEVASTVPRISRRLA